MEEKELLENIKAGDQSAFKELFLKYNPMVFSVCRRMLGDAREAEDLTQEVFLNVHRSIGRFGHQSKISTWIYRICVNLCLNRQAKLKRMKWLNLEFISAREGAISDESPDRILERKETEEIIQGAINSLPEKQRIAILLSRYEGLSYDEIAEITESSVSSVESRLFRAKQNLSGKLIKKLK